MDYREKNPDISYFPFGSTGLERAVCPFDAPNQSSIREFLSADEQTVFLSIYGGGEENENYDISSCFYLIEAPRSCKMRQAFEVGKIASEDYWSHKGWLIEARMTSLFSEGFNVRYVHPSMISDTAKKYIQQVSGKNLIQQKYEGLLWLKKVKMFSPEYEVMLEELERKYAGILKAA